MTKETMCSDCPPAGYPTDKTRCYGCPLANTYRDATGELVIPTATPSSNEQLQRERDAWEQSAAQFCRNMEYYRGLVDEIGKLLGDAAYIADDGSRSEDILRAKVPELVKARLAVETKARPPHWTCKTHGDFDAMRAVGCPECMRLSRQALIQIQRETYGSRWEASKAAHKIACAALDPIPPEEPTPERPLTLGKLVVDTARGNVKERILTELERESMRRAFAKSVEVIDSGSENGSETTKVTK